MNDFAFLKRGLVILTIMGCHQFSYGMGYVLNKNKEIGITREIKEVPPVCHNPVQHCGGECGEVVSFMDKLNSSKHTMKNAYIETEEDTVVSCEDGKPCHICFSENNEDCIEFIYTEAKVEDSYIYLTPNALRDVCFVENTFDFRYFIPEGMKELCQFVKTNSFDLGTKINCINHPSFKKCQEKMLSLKQSFDTDLKEFNKCQSWGYLEYNKTVTDSFQRSPDCRYSYEKRDHGTPKRVWRDLMPSSCGDGAFVAENGLDCCTSNDFANACVGSCQSFYVDRYRDFSYLESLR